MSREQQRRRINSPAIAEQRFFGENKPLDPLVSELLNFVKNQHSKYDIVSDLVNNAGYPIWNKSISFTKNGLGRNSNGDADTSVTFIPFVKDSQNFVNSTLIIRSERGDTSFKMIYDFQYKEYSFGMITDDFTAKDILNIFMTLDKEVFDRRVFQINDGRLVGEDTTETFVVVIDTTTFSSRSNVVTPLTICNTVTSYAPCSYVRTTVVAFCMHEFQMEYCTTVWEATNEFPPGGGGGWVPPPGPCGNNRNPEPCEPGWEPYLYELPGLNLCDFVAALTSDNTFKGAINDLKGKITDNKEWGRHYRADGMKQLYSGPSNDCQVRAELDLNSVAQLKCFLHSHYDKCLPTFSPGDFESLEELYYVNKNNYQNTLFAPTFSMALVTKSGSGVNDNPSDVYVMIIENSVLFEQFCQTYINDEAKKESFSQYFKLNFNIKLTNSTQVNELEYLKFLRSINAGVRILKASQDLSSYYLLNLNRDGTSYSADLCN